MLTRFIYCDKVSIVPIEGTQKIERGNKYE